MLPQGGRVDIVEQVKAAVNAVVFPQRALGPAMTGRRTEFSHQCTLLNVLPSEGYEDAAAFVPLADNVFHAYLANRLEDGVAVVLWMLEGNERRADFIANVLVTWRELVAGQKC